MTQYVADKVSALRLDPNALDPDSSDESEDDEDSSNAPAAKRRRTAKGKGKANQSSKAGAESKEEAKEVEQQVAVRTKAPRERIDDKLAYSNVAVLRSNAMKHMPNFFHKHQVSHSLRSPRLSCPAE